MTARMVAFHLTDRCNLNCQHCLRDPDLRPTDLGLDVIDRVLDQAVSGYRIGLVALTGGEPFLHPEIDRVIDSIVAHGMQWHAVTNGSRLPQMMASLEEKPERLASMARLYFSLDGAEEKTHDEIRGAGSYREVMRAISLCTMWEKPFVLQMVVNAKNVDEIEAFGLQAAILGAERASFAWLQPTGTHLDAELFLPRDAWKRAQARIDRLNSTLRIPVGMPEGFPTREAFSTCAPWMSHTLHVNVEGHLSLCCQLAGVPSETGRSDVLADMRTETLFAGHGKMVDVVHELQKERIAHLSTAGSKGWDDYNCNWCLKQFGKPHWTDDGASGREADRERWRGVWAEGSTGKPSVRDAEQRVHLSVVGNKRS